ncbi:MAG: segregation/condensation protein A [Desulfobacterales bacterium]|nr:segregation/condensation protein A [Desulfobacterales bacterium]
MEENYKIKIDNIFEGPMDLLVYLIKKHEVDIYDIPIALITDQYIKYLEWIKTMDLEYAGDFVVMASTLMQIKSKMMLPVHEGLDDEEAEDPRLEIARPLMEYLQLKTAAEQLYERSLLGRDTFIRTPKTKDLLIDDNDDIIKIGLFELIDAFQKILDNISPDHKVDLTADRISVKDRISELIDIFEKKESITFNELFPSNTNKSDIIITFLAILEMVKLCLIQMVQHMQTGIIRLIYI